MGVNMIFVNHFIDHLKSHGYPEGSIGTEYHSSAKEYESWCDIIVIDGGTLLPLQIFELKSENSAKAIHAGIYHLKGCLKKSGNDDLPVYLVFPSANEEGFVLKDINRKDVDPSRVFNYNINYNISLSRKQAKKEKEKKENRRFLKWCCPIISVILTGAFIFTKIKGYSITDNDLISIGIIVSVFLLTCIVRLKIGPFEIEIGTTKKETKTDEAN